MAAPTAAVGHILLPTSALDTAVEAGACTTTTLRERVVGVGEGAMEEGRGEHAPEGGVRGGGEAGRRLMLLPSCSVIRRHLHPLHGIDLERFVMPLPETLFMTYLNARSQG